MKKILIAALAVIVVTALAITCPDREKHVEAIESVFDYVAQRSAQKPGSLFDGQYLDALFLSRIASAAIDRFLKVDNYFVVSIGRITLPDTKPQVVSVGVFGHVFTLNKQKVYESLTGE